MPGHNQRLGRLFFEAETGLKIGQSFQRTKQLEGAEAD